MRKQELCSLKEKLARGDTVFGSHLAWRESAMSEMLGVLGYDYLWIDSEHSLLEKSDIFNHLVAAKAGNVPAFVRVAWNDPTLLKPILEMGPDGIIVPYIRSVEEAKAAVEAFVYPPKGVRGFGPIRGMEYRTLSQKEYLECYEQNTMKILMIEHIDMINCLEEICNIEGIDMFMVGSQDLSASLGILGQFEHPDMLKACDRIGEICTKYRIPFGVSIGYLPKILSQWKDRGAQLFTVGGDTVNMVVESQQMLERLRNLL